ncbi:MAG: PilN domain-containing protein [Rhodocyclaceae bacterium]|nr:PilN domain-containing protein [Rhodocyclaceae bacterium]MDP1957907.1 PilN domain-containing protein [Rhodocyclaceae bacterium]
MSQQINLYDAALLKQRDWLSLSNVVIAGVLLLLVAGALGALARHEVPMLTAQTAANDAQLKAAREQITVLGQQVAGRKPDPRLEQMLGVAHLLLSARSEVLTTLQQRLGPDAGSYAEYLRGFSRQSLTGLWLTEFSFAAGGGMEIRGRTVDPALLPEYIRQLGRERAFQGRTFATLQLDEGKSDPAPDALGQSAGTAATTPKAQYHEFKLTPLAGAKSDSSAATVHKTPARELYLHEFLMMLPSRANGKPAGGQG